MFATAPNEPPQYLKGGSPGKSGDCPLILLLFLSFHSVPFSAGILHVSLEKTGRYAAAAIARRPAMSLQKKKAVS